LNAFLLDVIEAKLHVVAGDLPCRNLPVTPVDLGIVNIGMAMRRATLRVTGIELMDPLCVMVSAFAGFLRRKSRVGFGQIIDFIHEVTLTQMGV
jgi:hypothetical protein